MKTNHNQEDIITAINDTIENNDIKFPIKNSTATDAIHSFKQLRDEDSFKTLRRGEFFHRYDYNYDFSDIYIQSTLNGLKASNYHVFDVRMECDSINSPSPTRTWATYKFRKSLLGALFTLKMKEVTPKNLATCITMRKYVASQFKPSSAKCLYELFDAKNVLDFSSGWGDRLIGFMACENTVRYVGIDPNEKLVSKYKDIINQYNGSGDKDITMIQAPAEDVTLTEKFDFIFTSPPYFNIEKYTHEPNQSFKRYRKVDQWLEGFLFKTIGKCWDALEDGGVMAINIGDVYSGHTINKLCDPMNDYISKLEGANYMGAIGYRMQKRIQSKSFKTGTFAEPIWIWGKGDVDSIETILQNKGINPKITS